ncbi:MAG: hypothetical protein J7577_01005 [Sphingobacteriaceae bacterium]|nr:hypothetical protein [Sphingobacteriaceae bacterium]
MEWKLISYEKGANAWRAPLIRLEVLKDTSTVPQCEPQQNFNSTTEEESTEQLDEQLHEPQGTHNIKPITYNLKPITGNNKPEQAPDIIINYSFDDFWDDYDKKVGKKEKLIPKWQKLKDLDRELIRDFLPKYKLAQPNKKFRKNPETFLNNQGWKDELIFDNDGKTGSTIEQKRAERNELVNYAGNILANIAAKHGIGCA